MSRRMSPPEPSGTGPARTTSLGAEFQRLGLIRIGQVARTLHMDPHGLTKFARAGQVKTVAVPWGKQTFYGMAEADLRALHDKMWPRCPWAAKGLCRLAEEYGQAGRLLAAVAKEPE